MRLIRRVAWAVLAIAAWPVTALWWWANGVTSGSVALLALSVCCVIAGSSARWARGLILVLLAGDVTWLATRVARRETLGPLRSCFNARCDAGGPWWQRVPDEEETARAGLSLARLIGAATPQERETFDRLLVTEYARLPSTWRGAPNSLFKVSTPSQVDALVLDAVADGRRPCVVFLHGFGGLLTPYLSAMQRSWGERVVVVAPALDPVGAWWSERGQAVIEATLEALPSGVDPQRVFVVGLSNGGVGASTLTFNPELRKRLAGVVLLSGIMGPPESTALSGFRVLVISGRNDSRFSLRFVAEQTAAFAAAGANVEALVWPADHFLILSHAPQWTEAVERWMKASGRDAHEVE